MIQSIRKKKRKKIHQLQTIECRFSSRLGTLHRDFQEKNAKSLF
jgi:hypothetical protein